MLPVLVALALIVSPDAVLAQFLPVSKDRAPKTLVESVCPDPDGEACWDVFLESGSVWAGDVNGDGVEELMLHPGLAYRGSGGWWYFLYQERGGKWESLFFGPDDEGWQVRQPRLDILPIIRTGYHDLRLTYDKCLKWDGIQYELYQADDYRRLSPELFDASSPAEAEILWNIRYFGLREFTFEPHWFRPNRDWTDNSINDQVEDPDLGVRWVAFFKAGVWGVKGEEWFLLLPQPAYLGASRLQLSGDWLLIYGEAEADDAAPPVARYNRRTSKIEILHRTSTED